jgi:hypothetical protein
MFTTHIAKFDAQSHSFSLLPLQLPNDNPSAIFTGGQSFFIAVKNED